MIRLSSNSLGHFLKCEQNYYNAYKRGKRLREFVWPLEFGTAVHEVMGTYDYWRLGKGRPEDAVIQAVKRADELSCEWEPWRETTVYNSWNLARIPVWYEEKFGKDNVIDLPIGYEISETGAPSPSVSWIEIPFEFEYRGVMLNGRLDALVSIFGENFIVDRKSTTKDIDGNFISSFSPGVQFSFYLWIAKKIFPTMDITGLLCEAIQLQVGSVQFERFVVRRSDDELLEFEMLLNNAIDRMKYLDGQIEYNYLKNESACFMCYFKKMCAASRPERARLWDAEI